MTPGFVVFISSAAIIYVSWTLVYLRDKFKQGLYSILGTFLYDFRDFWHSFISFVTGHPSPDQITQDMEKNLAFSWSSALALFAFLMQNLFLVIFVALIVNLYKKASAFENEIETPSRKVNHISSYLVGIKWNNRDDT
jgi:hypothetical protein